MKDFDQNRYLNTTTVQPKRVIHKGFKTPRKKQRKAHKPSNEEQISRFSTVENTPIKVYPSKENRFFSLSSLFFSLPKSHPFNTSFFKFEFLQVLGKGAFGDVYLVRDFQSRKLFAIKSLSKAHLLQHKQVEHVKNEINLLARSKNPFIVEQLGFHQDRSYIHHVMEYVPGGELYQHLVRVKSLCIKDTTFYSAQIVLAFEYLH